MSKKVLLIGDAMLDINTHGTCSRISPEAPVQVIRKNHEVSTLGGAGNNLINLYHLNVKTDCLSVVGNDECGDLIKNTIEKYTEECLVIQESTRMSTVKNRIISNGHQVLRIDTEDTHVIEGDAQHKLVQFIEKNIQNYDIILISDYNKGVCNNDIIHKVIRIASKHNIKVVCDPKKKDIQVYKGCYIITPNKVEAEGLCGFKIITNTDINKALLFMKKYIENPIITLSEKGIAFLNSDNELKISQAHTGGIIDVTGAGDTVISTICYSIIKGLNVEESISMANRAAAIVVKKFGTAFVTEEELCRENLKILNTYKDLKNPRGKVVFTNGCFDILHTGHVTCLNEAKKLGDTLIVGVNSDSSIKKLKGENRPINKLHDRMTVLSSLESVDYVIPFNEDTPYCLIKNINPDIIVKGGDYKVSEVVGHDIAKETVIVPFLHGFSTTSTIKSIKG